MPDDDQDDLGGKTDQQEMVRCPACKGSGVAPESQRLLLTMAECAVCAGAMFVPPAIADAWTEKAGT